MEDILQDELSNVLTRDAIAAAANDLNLKLLIALTVDLASELFIVKNVSCQIIVRDRRSDEKDHYHALMIDTCSRLLLSVTICFLIGEPENSNNIEDQLRLQFQCERLGARCVSNFQCDL